MPANAKYVTPSVASNQPNGIRQRSKSRLREATNNNKYVSNRGNSRVKSDSKQQYYSNNNNPIHYRDYAHQYKEMNNGDVIDTYYNKGKGYNNKKENVKVIKRTRVASVKIDRNQPTRYNNYGAKPVWWG